jgi:hypothetical protein
MRYCVEMIRLTSLKSLIYLVSILAAVFVNYGCVQVTSAPTAEKEIRPTPTLTLQELTTNLSSENMTVRVDSINALEKYGNQAVSALPALISNLHTDDPNVRAAAADALGKLGVNAQAATPDLILILETDNTENVRDAAAKAMQKIGEPVAIPALADCLFEGVDHFIEKHGYNVAISCSNAIAQIVGEKFRDMNSTKGYTLDKDGIPLIVIDARNWWLETGKSQNWGSINN